MNDAKATGTIMRIGREGRLSLFTRPENLSVKSKTSRVRLGEARQAYKVFNGPVYRQMKLYKHDGWEGGCGDSLNLQK